MKLKEKFKGISNTKEESYEDCNDNEDATSDAEPFKVEAKNDIPIFDDSIDANKLDSQIDHVEFYFTIKQHDDV